MFVFICLVGHTESHCFVRSHNRSVNFQYDLNIHPKSHSSWSFFHFKRHLSTDFQRVFNQKGCTISGLEWRPTNVLWIDFSMKLWDLPTRNHYKVHKHHHTFFIQFSNFVEEHVVEQFCKFVLELARICQNILVQIQ